MLPLESRNGSGAQGQTSLPLHFNFFSLMALTPLSSTSPAMATCRYLGDLLTPAVDSLLRPWHKPPLAEGAAWRNAAKRSANRSGPSTCSSEAPGSATTAVKASCPHSDSACGTQSPRRARKFVRRMSSRSAICVWSEMADACAVVASVHDSSSQVGSGFRLDWAEDCSRECPGGIGMPLRQHRCVCAAS